MYVQLCYIMENNNGDVVVVNFYIFNVYGVVVVIDQRGNYCFIYIGYFLGL